MFSFSTSWTFTSANLMYDLSRQTAYIKKELWMNASLLVIGTKQPKCLSLSKSSNKYPLLKRKRRRETQVKFCYGSTTNTKKADKAALLVATRMLHVNIPLRFIAPLALKFVNYWIKKLYLKRTLELLSYI